MPERNMMDDLSGLAAQHASLKARYRSFQEKKLQLTMARGIPSPAQLDLSQGLMTCLDGDPAGLRFGNADVRSYGMVDGLPSAKALFAELLDVPAANVIVGGNSSLNMMYDTVLRNYAFGVNGHTPWTQQGTVKFLCPVPGYDRHFTICEQIGIEMIPIRMTETGPDMQAVSAAVADPAVKGIWCVPKYANPTGVTYSDETVRAFANLKPAAPDFRIYWDNAYCVHDIFSEDSLLNLFSEVRKTGRDDLVYLFASTSKISYPGSGIACMVAGDQDIAETIYRISAQTICPDKLNQLRHVRYFQSADGIRRHMEKHAALLRPKFEAVEAVFAREVGDLPFVSWSKPNGGYFISLNVLPGTAALTIALARDAGVQLTPAGSTWPYKQDPADQNIRIAPTYPTLEDIEAAMELVTVCIRLAALEKAEI